MQRRPLPPRFGLSAPLVVAVTSAAMVVGCAGSDRAPGPDRSARAAAQVSAVRSATTAPAVQGSPLDRVAALEVLRTWDERRARAFAAGDLPALRALYTPGSAAGTADVQLLRDYRSRGLRVHGMRMQVLAVDVLLEARRRIRLRVTDRLTGAVAVAGGTRMPLPRDVASTSVVELTRRGHAGSWRVARVRESAPRRAGR